MTKNADTTPGDLRLCWEYDAWIFRSGTSDRLDTELAQIEDDLDAGAATAKTAVSRLTQMLAETPHWLEGLALRAYLKDVDGDAGGAKADAEAAYRYGLGKIREAFKGKRGRIEWGHLENRPFLRAAASYTALLLGAGEYDEAAKICRQMLRWNPNDNQGMRFILGPSLLRAGQPQGAERALEKIAPEHPAMGYELALTMMESGRWTEAATVLRRADAENPYIAYRLVFARIPRPMPVWMGWNLGDYDGADDYAAQWGARWTANEEHLDFLWFVHTHPKTTAERAAVLEANEQLQWESDPMARGRIIEQRRKRIDLMDDTLSEEIVRPRTFQRGGAPDRPWRVARRERVESERLRRLA